MRPEFGLPDCSKLTINRKNHNNVTICRYDVTVKLFWRGFFLLSSLVTGPSFTSISSLVLKLWQFSFIKDWPEIWKSEISPSEFCPISELYLIYLFWVITEKPTEAVKLRIGINTNSKFGSYTNSNMENSMMLFPFSVSVMQVLSKEFI